MAGCARCLPCDEGLLCGIVSGLVSVRLRAGSDGDPPLGPADTNPASKPSHCCACCCPLEWRSAHTLGVFRCTGRIRPVSTYIRTRTDPGGTGGDRGPKWTSLGRVSGRWGVFGLRGAGRRRGRHLRRFRSAVCAARPGGRGTVRAVAAHLRTRAGPGGTGGDRGPIFAFMGRSWAPWGPFFASRRRPARRRH